MGNESIFAIVQFIWNVCLIIACIYLGNDVLDFGSFRKKTKFKYPLRISIASLTMVAVAQNIFTLKNIMNPITDIVKEFFVICTLALIFFNCKDQKYGRS